MSLVLIVARAARPAEPGEIDTPAARDEAWRAVRDQLAQLTRVPAAAVANVAGGRAGEDAGEVAVADAARELGPDGLARLANLVATDPDDPTVAYASGADETVEAVRRLVEGGAAAVAVLPVGLAVTTLDETLRDPDLAELHQRLHDVQGAHPGVEIEYLGPPFAHPPALEAALAALRPAGSEEPALFADAVDRAFDGDLDRFARFMGALQGAVPPGTRLILRGSAVQGLSYTTGEPFDVRGHGTSDLDIVLIGEAAMAAWAPEAFYLPGVNSQPLDDAAPGVATRELELAREAAQKIAGRPVALQAMARWFLDLRSALQGTPYVVLGG